MKDKKTKVRFEEAVAFYDEYKELFAKLKRLAIWKEN